MAKKLILLCLVLFLLGCSPAYATEWVCYEGYQIEEEEQNVASASALPDGSDEGAKSKNIFYAIHAVLQEKTFHAIIFSSEIENMFRKELSKIKCVHLLMSFNKNKQ